MIYSGFCSVFAVVTVSVLLLVENVGYSVWFPEARLDSNLLCIL